MARALPPSVPECVLAEEKFGLKVYELKKTLLFLYDPKIKIVTIGEDNDLETKNIFLMGATGAGKTCLLNALVNHLLDVKFEDNFRYVVKDETGDEVKTNADSQTEYVIGYLIFKPPGSKRENNYLIIDTPGLKDSKGMERELEVLEQIRTFLHEVDGIDELHCIGFVVNGTIARLQKQFKDVIDEFCRMFGENAKEILRALISFGYMKRPAVLDVLECSFLQGCRTSIFDNVALYSCNQPDEDNSEEDIIMSKHQWKQAARVYDTFLDDIDKIKAVSLGLTRETLNEITELHNTIYCFKQLVECYLTIQIDIKQCEEKCKQYQVIMKTNEQWEGTVQVKVRKKVRDINFWHSLRKHAHNCETCLQTCKYPCIHIATEDCPRSTQECGSCSCPIDSHVKANEIITHTLADRPVVYEDKKKLYDDARNNESNMQEEMERLRAKTGDEVHNIDEAVNKIVQHCKSVRENSLSHKDLTPQELIDQTLQQLKTENFTHMHVPTILEDLSTHISAKIVS